jgi:branched-subunit amino acid aminotransferase/4-amino-4-deoxychorismate lyase
LSANFVYQKIHALARKPLHAGAHAELLETSYKTLYGSLPGLTARMLEEDAQALLAANRYPEGSVQLMVYLFPDEGGAKDPLRIISCEKQLLYKGYTLWHAREKAVALPYEYPFPHFQTAVSLAAHSYAANYARRKGAGCVISENSHGVMYSAGETPLFAARGNEIVTPGIGDGACDSVERRLGIAAAEKAGYLLEEIPVTRAELSGYQELFTVATGGVTAIGECSGNIYSHSAAARIAEMMSRLRKADL